MANKRELKKFIRNACGAMASEILIARSIFPSITRKNVYDIVRKIASLQAMTLRLVSVSYDKTPDAFEDIRAYRADKRSYYKLAYKKLLENFDAKLLEIIKDMNAALPEDVRAQLKDAAAQ